jgi:hypothetical protein
MQATAQAGVASAAWSTFCNQIAAQISALYKDANLVPTVTGGGSGVNIVCTSLDDANNPRTYTVTIGLS